MAIRWRNWHGFVVFEGLDVPTGGGVQIEYRNPGNGRLYPCCIMPNLTEEELQRPCNNQDWNYATQFLGYVEGYQIRDNQVYWNYPVDFDGIPEERTYPVRLRRLAPGGAALSDDTFAVTVDPGAVVYLNNWHEWSNVAPEPYTKMKNWRVNDPTDVPSGWYVASDDFGYPRLTSFGMDKLPPVSYCPKLSGRYDVYLGFRETVAEMSVRLPGGVVRDFRISSSNVPTTRFNREIYLDSADFTPSDCIEIARRTSAEVNRLRRFGDLLYVKLVPAEPRQLVRPAALPEGFETVFYSEPYSICYFHCLQNEAQAARVAESYSALGVDKVICQTGRVGSRMMHYNSAAGAIADPAMGDDLEISNGAAEAMRHMNVVPVLAEACRKRGIRFLAEIGINIPYKDSPLESPWIREHEDCWHPRHQLFLDYSREDVREFSATLYAELADLPVDGIAVNCTRYPYGITGEDLVAVFRKFAAKIGLKRRKELEINLSIVAGLPEFYAALETLLAEDLVDSLCVGRMICVYPTVDLTPYRRLLDRYPGKKLYGKIDGWLPNHTGLNQSPLPRPSDCAELVKAYSGAGADGVFFYQSEQILIDPFLTRFVQSLKA